MDSDGDVEDERLAAVLGQSNLDQVIEAQPAASASSTLLRYSGGNAKGKGKGKKGFRGQDRDGAFQRQEVGQNYICQNCGKKGDHWLQDCPLKYQEDLEKTGVNYDTWADEADRRKAGSKIRWARGIPMNYMQECPTFEEACKRSVDGTCYLRREQPGKFFAYVHDASSTIFLGKHMMKLHTPVAEKSFFAYGEGFEKALNCLMCSVCANLLNQPELVPCCGRAYCRDCIIERTSCPGCKSEVLPHLLQPHGLLGRIAEKIRNGKMTDLRRREKEEQRRRDIWRRKQAAIEATYAEEERKQRAEQQKLALHDLHRQMLVDKIDKLDKKIAKKRTKILDDYAASAGATASEAVAGADAGASVTGGVGVQPGCNALGNNIKAENDDGGGDNDSADLAAATLTQMTPNAATPAAEQTPMEVDEDEVASGQRKLRSSSKKTPKDGAFDRAAAEERLQFADTGRVPEIRNPSEFELFKLCLKAKALRKELDTHDRGDLLRSRAGSKDVTEEEPMDVDFRGAASVPHGGVSPRADSGRKRSSSAKKKSDKSPVRGPGETFPPGSSSDVLGGGSAQSLVPPMGGLIPAPISSATGGSASSSSFFAPSVLGTIPAPISASSVLSTDGLSGIPAPISTGGNQDDANSPASSGMRARGDTPAPLQQTRVNMTVTSTTTVPILPAVSAQRQLPPVKADGINSKDTDATVQSEAEEGATAQNSADLQIPAPVTTTTVLEDVEQIAAQKRVSSPKSGKKTVSSPKAIVPGGIAVQLPPGAITAGAAASSSALGGAASAATITAHLPLGSANPPVEELPAAALLKRASTGGSSEPGAADAATSSVPSAGGATPADPLEGGKKKKKRKKLTPEEFMAWQESMRKSAAEDKTPPAVVSPGDTG
eukprot:CAMPEP_0178989400 /NCGR_PEP_ID=MMETSP0795-20121207/4341_1 /TAXON_ID=88552 /ORGANISM="Amoebophrya sp., Strain Ameob2" /LENGTH=886 /DNA_ID=CAMNT_0020680773 /DNA_START=224 /DNA_END=2885 /DNA_ORIENTATION=+